MHQILVIIFCYSLTCVFSKTLSNNSKTYTDEEGLHNEKSLNSVCSSSFECDGKLLCYNGVCRCSHDMFWNGTNCLMRNGHMTFCNTSNECQDTLQCKDTNCECKETDYWNGTRCILRKSFKDKCKSTEECGSLLYCARDICQCASSDYWSGSKCEIRKSVNVSCSLTTECGDSLQCSNKQCRCCESDYWNGTTCIRRKLLNSICTSDEECHDELRCYNNICRCPDDRYWNRDKCDNRKMFKDACKSKIECQQTLHCFNGQCTCKINEFWTHSTCTERKGLDRACTSTHECQNNLECTNYRCSCRSLYYWDGMNCSRKWPKECADITSDEDGIYTIYPIKKMLVYCIMRGTKKWTVIQRRMDGSVDFYRGWSDYKEGFGSVGGEYWLGNDNIHAITSKGDHELSVYLENWKGDIRYANYTTFRIGNEDVKYLLTVSGYSGDAGDSLTSIHNGIKFSTKDQDNDVNSSGNCAVDFHGAWWYNGCYKSNLNGQYNGTHHKGVVWQGIKVDYSMRKTLLMIRQR